MGILQIIVVALGLSMDAFAVAVSLGLAVAALPVKKAGAKFSDELFTRAVMVGLYFGFFQAAMPIIGFVAGGVFAQRLEVYSSWIAFAVLGILGGKLILSSLSKGETLDTKNESLLKPVSMLSLAVATSVDALAVGVSMAFLQTSIVIMAAIIGVITFVMSAAGVFIGNIFGAKYKKPAEFFGGICLVIIGLNMLRQAFL